MTKRIAVIQGHPDPGGNRFCHALADNYAEGAREAGHEIKRIEVSQLDFPLLQSQEEFESGSPPEDVRIAQGAIAWAEHLIIIYPLWLGTMPALLKGLLEQVFRPEFAFEYKTNGMIKKLLNGRSARIVVTMGMPAAIYRWYFGAHSLKSLERNVLRFSGIKPVKTSILGTVEGVSEFKRRKWLEVMKSSGRDAL